MLVMQQRGEKRTRKQNRSHCNRQNLVPFLERPSSPLGLLSPPPIGTLYTVSKGALFPTLHSLL